MHTSSSEPRLERADRTQLRLESQNLDELVSEDRRMRALWDAGCALDLSLYRARRAGLTRALAGAKRPTGLQEPDTAPSECGAREPARSGLLVARRRQEAPTALASRERLCFGKREQPLSAALRAATEMGTASYARHAPRHSGPRCCLPDLLPGLEHPLFRRAVAVREQIQK